MNFIDNIISRLHSDQSRTVLQEVRDGSIVAASAAELLSLVQKARAFLAVLGLKKGDRCALLAQNSIRWIAFDLACMAEGIIVVPLYSRQAPHELAVMIRDSSPALVCCSEKALREGLIEAFGQNTLEPPSLYLFDDVFQVGKNTPAEALPSLSESDPVTIIYTSGTSGEPKGVVLSAGNLSHMLACTNGRLDQLMGSRDEADRVFHYLPLCFAGSWILMLTALSRNSVLTLSTDLNKLIDELSLAAPDYFLNVPALLERVRTGVEQQLRKRGGLGLFLYSKGKQAWEKSPRNPIDSIWLGLARTVVFGKIRKRLGPNLKALICGSAPLGKETQLFFMMLGLPVLQVYGLTETTAICTMDDPNRFTPGRVGPVISGIEMKLGDRDEILVRGPNIFGGYWNRPDETARAFQDGWFRTGDQGEVDSDGNWNIIGRIKNLIILSSGHNIAPEPIEESLLLALAGAQHVVMIGNGRSFLSALITGDVDSERVETAIDSVNSQLPHYKRIHAFHLSPDLFTIENGLLTANGKLKRDMISERFRSEIEGLYGAKKA